MPYIDYVYYSQTYQGKASDREFREISIRAVDIVKMVLLLRGIKNPALKNTDVM